MKYVNTTAIDAVNNGTDAPDVYRSNGYIVATSEYVSTDAWRGYTKIIPAQGFELLTDDWVTGDWDDAPAGNSESDVEARLIKLEIQYGDIYIIFTPTSNVFSTSYAVLIRNNDKPLRRLPSDGGKTIAHKTKRYELPDGSWRVRYHKTDVISYNAPDDVYTLDSGGWLTRTTKTRINDALPAGTYVTQKNFEWFVNQGDKITPFTDGMKVKV